MSTLRNAIFVTAAILFAVGVFCSIYAVQVHTEQKMQRAIDSLEAVNDTLTWELHWFKRYIGEDSTWIMTQTKDSAITRIFVRQSWRFRIRPRLLASVGYVESRFQPGSISRAGASGILQVMPSLWWHHVLQSCGYWRRGDVQAEICAGAAVLRFYLDNHGTITDALSAYNSGYVASRSTQGRHYAESVTDYAKGVSH